MLGFDTSLRSGARLGTGRIHGDGEMARRIREKDWRSTPLGPIETWSEALVATVNLGLASSDTYCIFWGDEHVVLYNDEYRALLHEKHPAALGERGAKVWQEAWDVIGPQINDAYLLGRTTKISEAFIPILAAGRLQDGWYSYSFHPIYEGDRVVAVGNPGRDDTAAVQARVALQQSETRLSQVLGATTDAILGIGRDWKISYLNPAAARTYGAGPDVVGRLLWEVFPEAAWAGSLTGSPHVEQYRRAMDQGRATSFEAHYPAPLDRWLQIEVYPALNGIVLFSRDITDKRLAEEMLAQREKQLALAVDAADLAAWSYDPQRNIFSGDERMVRLFGISALEATAETWLASVHEDDLQRVSHDFTSGSTKAAAGTIYDTECRLRQADGSVRWVRAKAQLLAADGAPRLIGICEDVTARKHVEEDLRSTARLLTMAQEAGKIASWIWNLATDAVLWAEGAAYTYGRPPSEMASMQQIFSYIHEDDRQRVWDDLAPAMRGTGDYRSTFRVVWPNGGIHFIQAHGKAILSENKPASVVGVNLDVTERRQTEQLLLQTEKLAAVGRLASSIAHEINNPLESVTNLLYLMRNSNDLAIIHDYTDTAERELRRVSLIANQTLRFHKASTKAALFYCQDIIGDALAIFQGRLLNAGIRVEKRKRAQHAVNCFGGEIRQVLANLVGNAIDSMPLGGRLLLRSREALDWKRNVRGLVITVADTGTGIGPVSMGRLFEPFYTTKGIGGTGLGLWISQEIVDRHQGSLRVRSSQKVGASGTVFTVFLPFTGSEQT